MQNALNIQNSFLKGPPKRLEKEIQDTLYGILRNSMPNARKRYQLTKAIQMERPDLETESLSPKIAQFYLTPFGQRTPEKFLASLGVPSYPWLAEQFLLSFHQIEVSNSALMTALQSIQFHLQKHVFVPNEVLSSPVLVSTMKKVTQPRWDDINRYITLSFFITLWEESTQQAHGEKFNFFFEELRREIEMWGTHGSGDQESSWAGPTQMISQTEYLWAKTLQKRISVALPFPEYPLSKGPRLPEMRALHNSVRMWNLLINLHSTPEIEASKQGALAQIDEISKKVVSIVESIQGTPDTE